VLTKARQFLDQMRAETGRPPLARMGGVEPEIARRGTWHQETDEVEFGAMVAWRNNTHCIGRLHWRTLVVRDRRELDTADRVFEALVDHVASATNGGRIRPMITVFAAQRPGDDGIRIWNPQLIRYAGHRQPDGSIVGDPLHASLTDAVTELGWRAPGGRFDVLPIVIQMPGERPRLYELPPAAVLEVPLSHPDHAWFADLGLRWHALPAISNMRLEVGGVSYPAAPFNGWYMCTEIGGRNLSDVRRYDLLPVIAEGLGLDRRSDRSLWKDRALVELNVAVMHSFTSHGVAIVDHHAASRQFLQHEKNEMKAQRVVPAEWAWMVPPVSGSTSPIFHHADFEDVTLEPNFFYQPDPWQR
jgi:nitric-oxide synthase